MSRSEESDAKKVDVVGAARELAQMMKAEPSMIEKPLMQAGDALIAFYQDPNFGDSFKNLRALKLEAIEMAVQDVSSGVMSLRSSTLGVVFRGSTLTTFVSPHGTQPQGTMVFSISWKNIKAFQNWRNSEEEDIKQDDLNVAIYRLAAAMAQLMP